MLTMSDKEQTPPPPPAKEVKPISGTGVQTNSAKPKENRVIVANKTGKIDRSSKNDK